MPYFPQYENALLVEFANYRSIAAGTAAVTASAGDVVVVKQSANVSTATTVTLPSVSLGGPVLVKLVGTFGTGAACHVVPAPQDVTATTEVTIDGFNSVTLNNAGDQVVLASDGANWWLISKAHNTHDTF